MQLKNSLSEHENQYWQEFHEGGFQTIINQQVIERAEKSIKILGQSIMITMCRVQGRVTSEENRDSECGEEDRDKRGDDSFK